MDSNTWYHVHSVLISKFLYTEIHIPVYIFIYLFLIEKKHEKSITNSHVIITRINIYIYK